MIQPNFQIISVGEVKSITSKSSIECKLKLPIESVKKIISTKGTAFIVDSKIADNSIIYNAKAQFTFVYLGSDGLAKTQNGVEFSSKIPLETAKYMANPIVEVCLQDIKHTSQNGEYVVECTAVARASVVVNNEYNCLTGGDFLIKEKQAQFSQMLEPSSSVFELEDEFEVSYPIQQMLMHSQDILVQSVTSGIGYIVIDGEINVTMQVLPSLENSDIVLEKRNIPFRLQVENSYALPTMQAMGGATINEVAFKIYADENKNKTTISTIIAVKLYGRCVDIQSFNYAEDCYSVVTDLNCKNKIIEALSFNGQISSSQKCMGQAVCDIPENSRMITYFNSEFIFLQNTKQTDGYIIDGLISAKILFKNLDNEYLTVQAEMPVNLMIASLDDVDSLSVNMSEFSCKIRNNSIEFDALLKTTYISFKKDSVVIIDELQEGQEKQVENSAISIYLATEGQTLWDVSKQLGISQDNIMQFNSDIKFPLEDKQKVIVYRQLNRE